MPSPWIDVPLADYEGHMAHVGQAQLLDRLFAGALAELQPRSVAVLGAAGGNGFHHLPGSTVARTVAVDINPSYLRELERRHSGSVQILETVCGDLADAGLDFAPVDYIHAALVFEYADPAAVLGRIAGWLAPGGALGVVLQMPGADHVSHSPFASLDRLEPVMALRDPERFRQLAEDAGFGEDSRIVALANGKAFLAARYRLRKR